MEFVTINQKIKKIKPEALKYELREESVQKDPFQQFLLWFDEALESGSFDASAMVLATVDARGFPDTRVVLLKELEPHKFIFYTSYQSKKAQDLAQKPVAALNFYWPDSARQIRIRGKVEKLPREKSEAYFSTRPRQAQLGPHSWVQSSILRDKDELSERLKAQAAKFEDKPLPCPENWGGYALIPFEYEFFQRGQWRAWCMIACSTN